jgi:hypothetical protein
MHKSSPRYLRRLLCTYVGEDAIAQAVAFSGYVEFLGKLHSYPKAEAVIQGVAANATALQLLSNTAASTQGYESLRAIVELSILHPKFVMKDFVTQLRSAVTSYDPQNVVFPLPSLMHACRNIVSINKYNLTFPCDVSTGTTYISFQPSFSPDLLLMVEGQCIPCHKVFLASCSQVFSVMFTSPSVKEYQATTIELEEVEYEVMEKIVRACYVPRINVSSPIEFYKLLIAADKYQMNSLLSSLEGNLKMVTCRNEEISEEELRWILQNFPFLICSGARSALMAKWLTRFWRYFELTEFHDLAIPHLYIMQDFIPS